MPTLAAVYIGTVVGAGFASGQEVLQFFGLHGRLGYWGIAVTTVVLAGFGYLIMSVSYRLAAASYAQVLRHVAGPVVGRFLDVLLSLFLFSGTGAMCAGAGATLAQIYDLPYTAGLVSMALATALTVALGLRGVVRSVSAVVPFLLVSVLLVGAATVLGGPLNLEYADPGRAPVGNWLVSAVVYGSYNLLLATSVLTPLARVTPRRNLLPGVVLGALGLGVGVLAVDLSIMAHAPESAWVEVPMVLAATRLSRWAALAYTLVLLAEVYTTAVSGLYGFVNRLVGEESRWFVPITLGAVAIAALAGLVGFSRLVATLFSVAGYLGLIFLVALVVAAWQGKRPPKQ